MVLRTLSESDGSVDRRSVDRRPPTDRVKRHDVIIVLYSAVDRLDPGAGDGDVGFPAGAQGDSA